MANFDNAFFRAGHQGYLHMAVESALLLTPGASTDPAAVSVVATPVGPAQFPAQDFNENLKPVEAIGDSRDQGFYPGVRERGFRARVEVADGAFLEYAVRDHADPSTGVLGLQPLTFEAGTGSNFDAGSGFGYQYIDALINSVNFTFAEGQSVSADLDVWAPIGLPTVGQTPVIPAADVLHWGNLSWVVNGIDYMTILSSGRIGVNNNLDRRGMRPIFLDGGGAELAVSRTCRKIIPKMEKLQVSYQLHDMLPAELYGITDWGTMILRAEQPGSGGGRRFLQIEIDHNQTNRPSIQQAGANAMLTFSADVSSRLITITSGVS